MKRSFAKCFLEQFANGCLLLGWMILPLLFTDKWRAGLILLGYLILLALGFGVWDYSDQRQHDA